MATKKKMLQAAAGNAGGEPGPDIDEVFSTYLYEGTGGALTVNNGIDLSGEGGLVWTKNRGDSRNHVLFDTERPNGEDYCLFTNTTDPESENSSFNFVPTSTGYTFNNNDDTNKSGFDFVGWTFRKAPKFFDIVTYTGDGTAGRTISHDLGTTVGMLVVKSTSHATDWKVLHRSVGATIAMELNNTRAATDVDDAFWDDTPPTNTHFTVGSNSGVNLSGRTYVAYLFAHNDGDGGFGPSGDQDIIKCGSYTGTGGSFAQEITLGFEPQWVLIKRTDASSDWWLDDSMRGGKLLQPNDNQADINVDFVQPTATGFKPGYPNQSGQEYVYIAIRRGPLYPPESATEVFKASLGDSTVPGYDAPFAVDMAFNRYKVSTAGNNIYSRLTGPETLDTSSTATAGSDSSGAWDYMDGWYNGGRSSDFISWMWKRAPGFFDVVAYEGNSTAGRTVSHNLGVAPEMIWVKARDKASEMWWVGSSELAANYSTVLKLNSNEGSTAGAYYVFTSTSPTDAVFSLANYDGVNTSGYSYIAYLFASLPGISKVGSYTGTGSGVNQDIDCGFTSGARFVLLKRTNNTGDWVVFDTERGIVVGNDGRLKLNSTEAETFTDQVDPYSGGFSVTAFFNNLNDEYIFYAIA